MQNAKDTFYELLRQRLAALNPERTIALRGVVRPGVLVVENELVSAVQVPDCFRLSWGEPAVDTDGALPFVSRPCAIEYETAGSATNGGMDRGRALEEMDAELLSAVSATPRSTVKTNYTGLVNGSAATAMATNVWWGGVSFGKTVVRGERLGRTAVVQLMSYQEEGEL